MADQRLFPCTQCTHDANSKLALSSESFPAMMNSIKVARLMKNPCLDRKQQPVSNLSFISKLIEGVVSANLKRYVHGNELSEHLQSIYRALHSTETALLRVKNDILRNSYDREDVALILLDLSASFDNVGHNILQRKAET